MSIHVGMELIAVHTLPITLVQLDDLFSAISLDEGSVKSWEGSFLRLRIWGF
jgi:hypothetical protein